jgi:hypothetical protein
MRPTIGAQSFVTEKTLALAQVAGTYDAATSVGDVLIEGAAVYCTVVGATFNYVSIQTNQAQPRVLMTSTEGAVANLVADSHPNASCQLDVGPWTVRSGQKIQYTINGATGTGELRLILKYRSISANAII